MEPKKQFVTTKTKAGFDAALNSGKINENQIVFIEDVSLIWSKGKFYGGSGGGNQLIKLTQQEYDSLIERDSNKLYVIVG